MNRTNTPYYKPSKIDEVFFSLFGYYPTQEGKSYEMLVGAVVKILFDKKVILDERKRGEYDDNLYQIDASLYELTGSKMIEAKDFTSANRKVKRPELDKIAGALLELDFDEGYFFSATNYTRDAKKKAKASSENPRSTKLSLYHLVPSTSGDLKGRLEKIEIDIISYEIDPNGTVFNPCISDEAFRKWTEEYNIPTGLKSATEFYYDESSIHCKGYLHDDLDNYIGEYEFYKPLDKSIYISASENNNEISGKWQVDDAFIQFNGIKEKIDEINYKIKFREISIPLVIEATGSPILKVVSEDGKINKLITDKQLKGITFEDNGEILFDGSNP